MKKNREDRERPSRVAFELLSDEKILNYDAIPSLACASLDLKPEGRRKSEFDPKKIRPVEVWPGIQEKTLKDFGCLYRNLALQDDEILPQAQSDYRTYELPPMFGAGKYDWIGPDELVVEVRNGKPEKFK